MFILYNTNKEQVGKFSIHPATMRVAMGEWLARRTPNHKIVGSGPTKATWLIKNRPAWATGDDNGALVRSAVNEYLAIDRMAIVLGLPVAH